jgi:hypothetical protein
MRWLLILALSGSLWAQTGCPWAGTSPFKGGISISGTTLATGCTPGTTANCLQTYCGIPNNATGTGAPNGNVAAILEYSADSFTGGVQSNQRQRAMDAYAAIGQTTLVNGACDVVFFQGGGDISTGVNSPMILPTTGGSCLVPNGTPGTFWNIADPGQQNGAIQGCNVINAMYGLSATGTLDSAITSSQTSFQVDIPANRFWPANADVNSNNMILQVESEQMLVTTQAGSGTGSNVTVSNITRGYNSTTAAAHNGALNAWVADKNGHSTNSPLDLYDAVTLMNAIACNGWGNRHDIRVWGESHGGEMALLLSQMSAADKTAYRLAANNEYSCGNVDDWQVTASAPIEPPVDQRMGAVLASDNTESLDNAATYGAVSGFPNGAIDATSSGGLSGGSAQNTLWATYSVTADGANGGCKGTSTSYSLTNTTSLGTFAFSVSPQCVYGGSGCALHRNTVKSSVSVGNADQDVCTAAVMNYAAAAQIPIVIVSGSHGGDLGACGQSWDPASKMIGLALTTMDIPDPTYGVVGKGSSGGGNADSGGSTE